MLVLEAGATAPASPLTADAAGSLRFDGVKVTMAPSASASWANAEQEYVNIGGVPIIEATAMLRDLSTGAVLADRKEMIAAAYAGSGWGGVLADQMMEDLDVRLVNSFVAQHGDWLLPKA